MIITLRVRLLIQMITKWLFLANSGIINGRSETKFAPNDDITREEAAVIIDEYSGIYGRKRGYYSI